MTALSYQNRISGVIMTQLDSSLVKEKSPPEGGDWLSLRIEVLKISNRSTGKTQRDEDATASD